MDDVPGNVRANAIAKLKRAASLPRMNGRRAATPAIGEVVSETERGRSQEPDGDQVHPATAPMPTPPAEPAILSEPETESVPERELAPEQGAVALASELESDAPVLATAPTKKHRTRSRSRSRSKQRLKDGSRPPSRQQLSSTPLPISPPQSPTLLSSDHDSPDQQPSSLPAFDHPPVIPGAPMTPPFTFISTMGQPYLSPSALVVQSPMAMGPTSPQVGPPSLDLIREKFGPGPLQRSASARARTDALHKLTGGRVDPDHVELGPPSPPPATPDVALNRSNTVGGERVAVGRLMMRKLTERRAIPEGETSGEEIVVSVSPSRRRRRRSSQARRRSAGTSIVDDREMNTTPAPTTPSASLQRLPTGPSNLELDLYRGPSPAVSHTQAIERDRDSALARLIGEDHFEFDRHAASRRRGPVVEDDFNEDFAHNFGLPPRTAAESSNVLPVQVPGARLPHSSDAPSFATTSSSIGSMADRVPVYLPDPSLPSPYKQDVFPKSPFGTPMKERRSSEVDLDATENELQVPYLGTSRQNTPSWQTFPEHLYHGDNDEEDDDDTTSHMEPTENLGGESASAESTHDFGELVQAVSFRAEDFGAEHEVEDIPPSTSIDMRESQVSATSTLDAATDSLTLAPPQPDTRPDSVGADWEEIDPSNDVTVRDPMRGVASSTSSSGTPLSAWDKFKGAITRNDGSSSPMMLSRSASRAAGQQSGHVSQVSTDSVASSSSSRAGAPDHIYSPSAWRDPQYQTPLQTASASASSSGLPLPPPSPFTSTSPIPPVSPADFAKYGTDSKLQPFPVLAAMARKRGLSVSHSTPDVSIPTSGRQTPVSSPTGQFSPGSMDVRPTHGLQHQASDSKLLSRFNQAMNPAGSAFNGARPGLKTAPSLEYIDLPQSQLGKSPSTGKSSKFSWIKMRSTSPGPETQRPGKQRKPSLADLLSFKKSPEAGIGHANGNGQAQHAPSSFRPPEQPVIDMTGAAASRSVAAQHQFQEAAGVGFPTDRLPNRDMHNGRVPARVASEEADTTSPSDPHPRISQSDIVPDTSADESAAPSAPNSTIDSYASPRSDASRSDFDLSPKSSGAMLRFESLLSSGRLKSLDPPPRKLLYMSAVSQVASSSSVKNRFLFLFNDVLVVAQPAPEDESTNKAPLDRRYEVRNVIELHRLRLCVGRDDPSSNYDDHGKGTVQREPYLHNFIREFGADPERAIYNLQAKSGISNDPVAVGKLLFETVELDRGQLADYLAHRDRKRILKAFIDCFGFAGVRIDSALRVFLLSLAMPSDDSAFEVLLGVFASRWFEVNAGAIAYDKELTQRLVRSIVSLNDALHPPMPLGHYARYASPAPSITARNFIDAFRVHDPSGLIADDVLAGIYRSVSIQQMQQPPNLSLGYRSSPPAFVKAEGLPRRLTYRMASDSVYVRITYPDPEFSIQLQGKDLLFDPPELRFDKSPEASFKVTGTSLGVKSIIMCKTGAHASEYSGLPLSTNVTVERAYMKPVFQLAFLGTRGPRKYMFSVDESTCFSDWVQLLSLHISMAGDAQQVRSPTGADALYRASEAVAMEALRACIGSSYVGHELVILAQQNSLIPSVLSLLRGA